MRRSRAVFNGTNQEGLNEYGKHRRSNREVSPRTNGKRAGSGAPAFSGSCLYGARWRGSPGLPAEGRRAGQVLHQALEKVGKIVQMAGNGLVRGYGGHG